MKHTFPPTDANCVKYGSGNKDMLGFTKRLEKAIQRLSNGLSSSKAGALIQVWMPELCSRGRVLLSTEGLPFSISGVGDLLALFRCISCKYRFDADPSFGDSMGAIGRVYHYGQPELCIDVQQYDKNAYLRINEAQLCRIHSTLIFPIFDGDNPKALAVVELSHHDKSVEFANIVQLFIEAMDYMQLRTADVRNDNWKLGLRRWPVEVCSVPLSSIADSGFSKKHPDEQGISRQHILGRAMQTGFRQVSDFLMNIGMDSLTNEEHLIHGRFNEEYTVFQRQSSHVKNNSLSMDGALGFGTEISKCVSDSSSANTINFPEAHSRDSATPTDAVRVCQAPLPIAQKADQDMHSDSPKDETKPIILDDDKNSDDYCNEHHKHNDDGGSEAKKKENRLGGGAGKRLSYRDLEAHFGHGLKDAARRLGICPTTLKRACRRNGITRWPSRQISKLLKVWKQMGYKGEPPSWLLQNAISGNLRSENLAYILSSGLHVGLNPQRCECLTNTATVKRKQGHVSLYCSSVHDADPNGTMMIDEDIALKNLTHHGAFTAALHGTDEDGFAFQEEQDGGHRNNTWHAGHTANVVLHPSTFPCHSQSSSAIPVQTMHFSRDINNTHSKQREGPLAFDLERTQRGGTGIIPVLSELGPPVDAEDVLMQPFHLPLGFDASQNLFH